MSKLHLLVQVWQFQSPMENLILELGRESGFVNTGIMQDPEKSW